MASRALLAIVTTAVLVGGVFVLRTAAPTESVQAVSSVPTPVQTPTPGRGTESVSVVTEVVTAPTITSPRLAAAPSQSNGRARPAAVQKRSLLARVFLGNGEPRPQPFPRPGRTVTARP
jgi:hypothetical protein